MLKKIILFSFLIISQNSKANFFSEHKNFIIGVGGLITGYTTKVILNYFNQKKLIKIASELCDSLNQELNNLNNNFALTELKNKIQNFNYFETTKLMLDYKSLSSINWRNLKEKINKLNELKQKLKSQKDLIKKADHITKEFNTMYHEIQLYNSFICLCSNIASLDNKLISEEANAAINLLSKDYYTENELILIEKFNIQKLKEELSQVKNTIEHQQNTIISANTALLETNMSNSYLNEIIESAINNAEIFRININKAYKVINDNQSYFELLKAYNTYINDFSFELRILNSNSNLYQDLKRFINAKQNKYPFSEYIESLWKNINKLEQLKALVFIDTPLIQYTQEAINNLKILVSNVSIFPETMTEKITIERDRIEQEKLELQKKQIQAEYENAHASRIKQENRNLKYKSQLTEKKLEIKKINQNILINTITIKFKDKINSLKREARYKAEEMQKIKNELYQKEERIRYLETQTILRR